MTSPGRIVLLNGSSSAGKTVLSRGLQLVMDEPWQHVALDQFRDGMPGQFRGLNSPIGTTGSDGLNIVPARKRGEVVTEVRFGPMGHRMLRGMHRAVAAFASEGNNVIVDDLMLDPSILDDYLQVLRGFYVLFVGVRCPLDVVVEREKTRGGRFPGTALSHFEEVHIHGTYDIELDTSIGTPRQLAEKIKSRIASDAPPTAFATLRQERGLDE